MNTSRANKIIGAVSTLCWLTLTAAAADCQQAGTITRVPGLGGGNLTVRGLNNHGGVVGDAVNADGFQHAFLFTNGVLVDLGTLGGPHSFGAALNDSGVVVGDSDLPGDEFAWHAYVYRDGAMVDLGVLPGTLYSSALLVNAVGDIAGWSDARAFVYRNGQMIDIGSLGLGMSQILGLNVHGHAVGNSVDEAVRPTAFLFDGTTMRSLGTLGGATSSARAINDSGVIVGHADKADGQIRAFLYRDGTMTDLGTLGGDYSEAKEINNAGDILGWSRYESNNFSGRAFIVKNGVMIDLGHLGGELSDPYDMNAHGHVVGWTMDENSNELPFLYRDGQMVDVNSLLPPDSGWVLYTANFINDAGQIAGTGDYNGEYTWYILTPGNQNSAPEANAGDDLTVECGSSVRLDGSNSTGANNSALTYEWRNGSTVLGNSAVLDVSLGRGTHTLTLVVTDPCGASQDEVIVNVVDTTPPSVACSTAQAVPAGANCQAVVPDFASTAVALDGCSSVLTRSQTPAAGTPVGLGTHTVTVSVSDESGNVGACTVMLTVVDSTPPVGECPAARTVDAGSDCAAVVPDFTAALVATDNCTAAEALVKTQSPAAGTRLPGGVHTIHLTVTDAAGNSSACETTLTVRGNAQPTITAPAPVTVSAGSNGRGTLPDLRPDATVVESCSGPATLTQSPAPGTRLRMGVHTVTIRAVDPAGNVATCTTTCTVADTTPPTIKSISVDPKTIRRADGDMERFTVKVRAKDDHDDDVQARIISIVSSEPVTGNGDTTSPDWEITDDLRGRVRAEYQRGGDGRVYTITVECRDDAGNVATGTVTITVRRRGGGGD